jgi:hypothetical protein
MLTWSALTSRHGDWNPVCGAFGGIADVLPDPDPFSGSNRANCANQCWMGRKDCPGHAMLMAFAGRWRGCVTGADRIEWLRFEPSAGTRESGIAVFSSSDSKHILTPGWDWGSLSPKQSLDGVTLGGRMGCDPAHRGGRVDGYSLTIAEPALQDGSTPPDNDGFIASWESRRKLRGSLRKSKD